MSKSTLHLGLLVNLNLTWEEINISPSFIGVKERYLLGNLKIDVYHYIAHSLQLCNCDIAVNFEKSSHTSVGMEEVFSFLFFLVQRP